MKGRGGTVAAAAMKTRAAAVVVAVAVAVAGGRMPNTDDDSEMKKREGGHAVGMRTRVMTGDASECRGGTGRRSESGGIVIAEAVAG